MCEVTKVLDKLTVCLYIIVVNIYTSKLTGTCTCTHVYIHVYADVHVQCTCTCTYTSKCT